MVHHMKLEFDSIPSNESFARVVVAAFLTKVNPTMEELSDVNTAVSEAVTNAIIHGYENQIHKVVIEATLEGEELTVCVEDFGVGIENVEKAREPLFTTRKDLERSGMGFVFMEAFMDEVVVESQVGRGTRVTMKKSIGRCDNEQG